MQQSWFFQHFFVVAGNLAFYILGWLKRKGCGKLGPLMDGGCQNMHNAGLLRKRQGIFYSQSIKIIHQEIKKKLLRIPKNMHNAALLRKRQGIFYSIKTQSIDIFARSDFFEDLLLRITTQDIRSHSSAVQSPTSISICCGCRL